MESLDTQEYMGEIEKNNINSIQKITRIVYLQMSYKTLFIQVLKRTDRNTDTYFNGHTNNSH